MPAAVHPLSAAAEFIVVQPGAAERVLAVHRLGQRGGARSASTGASTGRARSRRWRCPYEGASPRGDTAIIGSTAAVSISIATAGAEAAADLETEALAYPDQRGEIPRIS
jgi:hypothetical protein